MQQKPLVGVRGPLNGEEGGNSAVFDLSAYTDNALRYEIYFMSDLPHSLDSICNSFAEVEE